MESLDFAQEYTVNGQFINEIIVANIKIPKQDPENPYEITTYNASKLCGTVKKNVIYCHLKLQKNNSGSLYSSGFNHTIRIDTANLPPIAAHNSNIGFDQKLNSTLIIILHEDNNNTGDRAMIFSNIEAYSLKAEEEGNFTDYLPNIASPGIKSKSVPRVLGVSIIKK